MPQVDEIRRTKEIGHKGQHKFIWHACGKCSKERWVRLEKGQPLSTICRSCGQKGRHPSFETRQRLSQSKIGNQNSLGKSPSLETRQKISRALKGKFIGENNWNWKGGKIECICQECDNKFQVYPSQLKWGYGKFCSLSCKTIYSYKNGVFHLHPNKPEQLLIDLFTDNKLPFKYVGDGGMWLGNRNPDFLNINGKKQVIELFGIYWHSPFDVADRMEHYKQYGFDTLIIWEDELKNQDKILRKIWRFVEKRCKQVD